MSPLTITYRGPLSSCNYHCGYCPFARHRSSAEELRADEQGLERFLDWLETPHGSSIRLFFAPRGEALIRPWYPSAIMRASQMQHVQNVAIQTNLSCELDWLAETNRAKVALWTTLHPEQVPLDGFLGQCQKLDALGVAYSVGLVGLREHVAVAEEARRALPDSVYLWINAFKDGGPGYYDAATKARFAAIDPWFSFSLTEHRSRAQSCRSGANAITVDGDGIVRRCLFVDEPLGNLYRGALGEMLGEGTCPNDVCRCHIGYVHLDRLGLGDVFGARMMARIPKLEQWDANRAR